MSVFLRLKNRVISIESCTCSSLICRAHKFELLGFRAVDMEEYWSIFTNTFTTHMPRDLRLLRYTYEREFGLWFRSHEPTP